MDMKKLILLPLILLGCSKPKINEPIESTIINQPIVVTSRYVEIYITYGAINNFCSIKWSYDPNIDSTYTSTNTLSKTIRNYTNSDSIYINTSSQISNQQQSNTVMVVVNGVIKEQYNGIQINKKVILK